MFAFTFTFTFKKRKRTLLSLAKPSETLRSQIPCIKTKQRPLKDVKKITPWKSNAANPSQVFKFYCFQKKLKKNCDWFVMTVNCIHLNYHKQGSCWIFQPLKHRGWLFNSTRGSLLLYSPPLLIRLYVLDFQIKHLLLTICICCCSTLKITGLQTSITGCPSHMKFQLWIRSRFRFPRPRLFHHGERILISMPVLPICSRAAELNSRRRREKKKPTM